MKKIIGVVSGKGGVGKTTFTVNTGLALKEMGNEVVLVDADMATSNLGLHLGFFQFPVGLQDALRGHIELENTIYTHPSGLKVIPSSISMAYIRTSPSPYRMKNLLSELDGFVMIDSPPGLGKEAFMVLKSCDEVLVVTNPELPAVTDAMKIIQVARELRRDVRGIVVNRVKGRHELRTEEIEEMCDARVIGKIPEERRIKKSLFDKTPIVQMSPHCPASVAFRKIAAGLAGMNYQPPRMLMLRRIFG